MVMLTLAVAITVLARTLAPPPKPLDVVGVWSGYGDQVEFLRLELDVGGTGYLAVSYLPAYPARLYRVESWRLAERSVEIQVRPIDPDAEPISFRRIRYTRRALEGQFAGSGWKRRVTLLSEREWRSRAAEAQERITRVRSERGDR